MKRRCLFFVVLVIVASLPAAARGQVSVYGEFSASNLAAGPQGDYLHGATSGVLIDGVTIFKRVVISANVNGRFVGKTVNGSTA